jgi:nitrogenase molybdenum-iron protein alpha/beta subunit
MSGAAACLAGFDDIGVVIHGSSGCLFYTSSLLEPAVFGSCIIESEAVFGTSARLCEVVEDVRRTYNRVAVINTCVPSAIGEDLAAMFGENPPLILDVPGFAGSMADGYHAALAALRIPRDLRSPGITIDGLNPIDPFYRGNLLEAVRLLHLAGTAPAAVISGGSSQDLARAGGRTVTTNPDCAYRKGETCGSFLGCDGVRSTLEALADRHPDLTVDAVEQEVRRAEEKIAYSCDKYLRRFDPPAVALFGQGAYARYAADLLHCSLDAEIRILCTRDDPVRTQHPCATTADLRRIGEILEETQPDLILGSDFEHSLRPQTAFVGITPPLRRTFRLRARSLCGTEGALTLIEEVLNACRNGAGKRP